MLEFVQGAVEQRSSVRWHQRCVGRQQSLPLHKRVPLNTDAIPRQVQETISTIAGPSIVLGTCFFYSIFLAFRLFPETIRLLVCVASDGRNPPPFMQKRTQERLCHKLNPHASPPCSFSRFPPSPQRRSTLRGLSNLAKSVIPADSLDTFIHSMSSTDGTQKV